MFISDIIIKNEILINKIENSDNETMYIYKNGDNSTINSLLINEFILRFQH